MRTSGWARAGGSSSAKGAGEGLAGDVGMTRVDQWLQAALPERKGVFRGLELGMPLRDALSLEGRGVQRTSDVLLIREELDESSWTELDLRFYRRKGADRLSGASFCLTTDRHFPDAEAVYQRVVEHFARALGAAQPLPHEGAPSGTRHVSGAAWRFASGRIPCALTVTLRDLVQEGRARRCAMSIELGRAGARAARASGGDGSGEAPG
jgi:hypothetical protein